MAHKTILEKLPTKRDTLLCKLKFLERYKGLIPNRGVKLTCTIRTRRDRTSFDKQVWHYNRGILNQISIQQLPLQLVLRAGLDQPLWNTELATEREIRPPTGREPGVLLIKNNYFSSNHTKLQVSKNEFHSLQTNF